MKYLCGLYMQASKDIYQIALHTIANERDAIGALEAYITPEFVACIQHLQVMQGRLIITGIGKSAIVAQKIVATLNSTGTPALFMHAADAIHGDLGMIQVADVILIISKSGESPEIKTLLPLVKGFGNTTIGMVGNKASYLSTQVDYVIDTTIAVEACPNNLAPTTSTTAQMVMGDVIAVCLMQLKGFNTEQFAKYHPGGALGKNLYLTVGNLVDTVRKPHVSMYSTLKEVIIEISKKRMGATAVLHADDSLAGIITDGDIRRTLERTDTITHIKAKDLVQDTPKTIAHDALATEALAMLRQHDIAQLIVLHQGSYYGMVHLHELLKEGIR